jgi:hypothetical protein
MRTRMKKAQVMMMRLEEMPLVRIRPANVQLVRIQLVKMQLAGARLVRDLLARGPTAALNVSASVCATAGILSLGATIF